MAVRNGGAWLEEALGSIANQTFTNWEMVMVDDASTDGSAAVARAWSARDDRVHVIEQSVNKGQTASLNEGLASCRGEWIARQDADDLSHPERLARQMAYLSRNPRTALLGTQGILIDSRGRRMGLLDVPCGGEAIAWCAPFLNPFLHTSVVFRREVVQQAGGYDENFHIAQDYELWTRLAGKHAVANLPERLVRYRHAETSLSKTGRSVAFAEADRVSAREVQRRLGRQWTVKEEKLVSEFRSGLPAESKKKFWDLIAALEEAKGSRLPSTLRAAWHLRLAGTGASVDASEVAAAFRAAPAYASRWLLERFFSF